MPEVTKYQQGTPSWLDLLTSDMSAAERFYGQLFGWEYKREPVGEDQFYSMQYLKGKTVAGIMEQNKRQAEQGMPVGWYTYITVDDVQAVTGKVAELGGRVIAEPFDVFDNGRMSMIQDPEGAVVNLWQPLKHIGTQIVNEPGTVIWNELVADDPEKLGAFYAALLGVEIKDMEGMPEYKLLSIGEKSVAGIFKKTGQLQDLPSHWSVYFAVDDTDAVVERTRSMGGELLNGPTDTPMGRFAVLKDPQGAVFHVIAYSAG